jgi:RimJ/RimL family protein N-acetyltransferase
MIEAESYIEEQVAWAPLASGEADRIVYYEGERIYFRPVELSDEPCLRRWINDPRVWRTLGSILPKNGVVEKTWIESLYKSATDVVFGIVIKDSDELIGVTGLHRIDPINRRAVFGITIGDVTCHNKGYGTEAARLVVRYGFEVLNLNRIELEVFANNFRGIRAYQKAGFQHEGCRRQAVFREGRYEDVYVFSILSEEYQAAKDAAIDW